VSLESARHAFLEGYRLARARTEPSFRVDVLCDQLIGIGTARAPFAVEGAGLALRLRDEREASSTVEALSAVVPDPFRPFLMLGVGCALARLRLPPPEEPTTLDGYGFQVGLASGASTRDRTDAGPRFHRGVGRAMWFVTDGDARACGPLLRRGRHQAERWRGAGTACAFAGDPRGQARELLREGSGFEAALRTGAADALRLWRSLGSVAPSRVAEVVEAFGPAD
jgi:hypothetical protein